MTVAERSEINESPTHDPPPDTGVPRGVPVPPEVESFWSRHGQLVCAIAAGGILLAAKIVGWAAPIAAGGAGGTGGDLAVHILVGVAFALGLYFGGMAAVESIRARKLDINLLMVLGAVLAIFVGAEAEGALLLFLFTLSGALERYAMQRTHAALESLVKLFPKEAIVLGEDGGQRLVGLEALGVGDRILVKPGENIAADGEVVEGTSAVDESAITGEFMPREKGRGDTVYAGTMNKAGRLVVRVSRPAQDTTLAKIIHLVSRASEEKAPVERLFDKVGSWYTATVLATSAGACLLMGFLFGVPWISAHDAQGAVTQSGAIYRAITLLIVASPCALIISTPVVILSAIATCARRGIILKGGRHLESLAALKVLVFDKTGTLTTGQVRMVGVELIDPGGDGRPKVEGEAFRNCEVTVHRALGQEDALRRRLLQVAASLESNSTHPLASAVMRAADAEGISLLPVTDFLQEAGAGIRGVVGGVGGVGGQACVIGSPALVNGLCHTRTLERLGQRIDAAHAAGETAVVLFCGGHAAVLRFSDTVRPGAAQVTASLHALGLRPLVMLTGDNQKVAAAVAGSLGLDEVRAELLPEQKLEAVTALVGRWGAVGMVGDGINDAPALARATVGIAMGSIGSDAAMQAADVVLLSDAIERLPWLVRIARRSRRVMAQNLTFAISVIVVLIVCSLAGVVGLPLGVVGHEGSTLLVVLNGLRLLMASPDDGEVVRK